MKLKRIFMPVIVTVLTAFSIIMPTAAAVKGDINGDGKVTVRDAAFIARLLAQGRTNELDSDADFNGDRKVNVRDAAAIAKSLSSTGVPVVTTKKTSRSDPKTTTSVATEGIHSIVYITRTGKKYHYSSTCNGGDYFPIKYEDAIKRGLKPCNKCVN